MSFEFAAFLQRMFHDPVLFITALLTVGVMFVNGSTDAPNAIATCVATRCLHPLTAVFFSSFFNFLGVWIMSLFNIKVAMTITNMVRFNGDTKEASIALCAALFAIIVWATAAWGFGIPTSESHALIAGLSGAAIALHNGFDGINFIEWSKVLYGLILSIGLGFLSGCSITHITRRLFRSVDRQKSELFFKRGQIFGAVALSFMHGAQDGQKFMAVLLLGVSLSYGKESTGDISIPLWIICLCALIMAMGSAAGGYKIIRSVGIKMIRPERYQGFSADIAAFGCLLFSSLAGFPVSTTHAKTAAILGAGAAKRVSSINFFVVRDMALAWLLTFPGCGFIGFVITKLFMKIIQ